ncbi:MAG: hypothetical protein OIF48_02280 [Silicimonas sp.]|nr:hypothetical protein [Silicimonas sp.]
MTGRVGILGLGRRGSHWAEAFLAAGWEVHGFDPDDRAGPREPTGAWRREPTITGAVSRADWVVCCLPDRLDLLRAVIQRAQASARRAAVIAVVSETFEIDALQGCATWPGHVIRLVAGEAGALALDVNALTTAATRDEATDVLALLTAGTSAAVQTAPEAQVIPLIRAERL